MSSPTYRTLPIHQFDDLTIGVGMEALARALLPQMRSKQRMVLAFDGFLGVEWQVITASLDAALAAVGVDARWFDTAALFIPPDALAERLRESLTADSVFGRLTHQHLSEWWDNARFAAMRQQIEASTGLTIIVGYGAASVTVADSTIYADVPKDRGQALAAQGRITNIGAATPTAFAAMYKRMYFVDWPVLNRLKRAVLPNLDWFVDATDSQAIRFTSGAGLRATLARLARQPFRVKPWFAPGPWGGQWMKEQFGLDPSAPNYAWSFELIAPENGVLLGNGDQMLECSFDLLLWTDPAGVLGAAVTARYGTYFPIRFDYLDTMGGTNLSCQVHPQLDYMRDEFGEPFTQDETYYIVTNAPGARVYLGLRDAGDVAAFRAQAEHARDHEIPFAIDEHVQAWDAQAGDLFLIPSGTVHCSGANNLVLEISATPYIYTFKIYDYLRTDLQGELRQTHIERAFANLDATRRATWVREHLLARPRLLRQGDDWQEEVLSEIDTLFFSIHRLTFQTRMDDATAGRFLAYNLVEGTHCMIAADGVAPYELHFAESLILPAVLGNIRLRNLGRVPAVVVKAFVR